MEGMYIARSFNIADDPCLSSLNLMTFTDQSMLNYCTSCTGYI